MTSASPLAELLQRFEALSEHARRPCLLGAAGAEGFVATLASDPVAVLEGTCSREGDPARELERFVTEQSGRGRLCVGYCSYELGRHLHGFPPRAPDPALPDYSWLAYETWLAYERGAWRLHSPSGDLASPPLSAPERPSAPSPSYEPILFQTALSADRYAELFRRVAEYIRAGDIYQVNLTHRLQGHSSLASRQLFPFVARSNPVEHLAYLEGQGHALHSASPERFVRIRGRQIETLPIKGTRPRGADPEQDRAQLQQLMASEKEAAELHMITDLLRNDLAEVCVPGSVRVADSRVSRAGPSVWHTLSRITGTLEESIQPFAAVLRMLPGGSISGCPKRRALEIIDELEAGPRGVYTGVIGRVEPNGDADFSVAIRSLVQHGSDVYLSVGGGIVYDSILEQEFAETLLKASSFANLPARFSPSELALTPDP